MALMLRHAGARSVSISEPSVDRANVARSFNFMILDSPPTPGVDFVFDCTGHPSVSPTLLPWVRTGGTLMLVGVYPGLVELNLQQLLFREISVRTARVYTDSDIAAAVDIVSQGAISGLERIVTAVFPIESAEQALSQLNSGTELKVLLELNNS
jgi:threonine dehydrogenase-like Zn-dependent dehydrogenase